MYKKLFVISLMLLLSTPGFASDKLVFAVDIIRHGDRTPLHDITPYHQWQVAPGELTATGMAEEYHLGQQMRQLYVRQTHLLPMHYQSDALYVSSSDYNRTLISADAFLMGLYPLGTGPKLPNSMLPALPRAYQPIPIHTEAMANDKLFFPLTDKQRKRLEQKYVFNRADWQAKQQALQPYFAAWSKTTGLNIASLDDIITLGDTLYIRSLYHVALPSGISPKQSQEILKDGQWALATLYGSPEMGRAYSHNLKQAIDHYLQGATHADSPLKYVLFSAHDTTILAMLSDLGVATTEHIPYASDLNFQLWESDQHQYLVKISFNGTTLHIPACAGKVCTLSQFIKIAS